MSRSSYEWTLVCHEAVDMNADEKRALEALLLTAPNDLEARIKLIGADFIDEGIDAQRKRIEHLEWLACNHPEIDLGGYAFVPFSDELARDRAELCDEWIAAAARHPDNLAVFKAAASVASFIEPRRALALCERAAERAPKSADWRDRIAQAHVRLASMSDDPDERRAHFAAAARELATVLALTDDALGASCAAIDLAAAAAGAGDWTAATEAAMRALRDRDRIADTWQYGNVIHRANIVLGRAALANGDVDTAERHLIAAGETPGSPQLNSFGPDRDLAAALLDAGRAAAVTRYLEACKRFWRDHEGLLDGWIDAIRAGEKPTFAKR